jgi:hypothetical protein
VVRTQIQLTETQAARVRQLAERRGVSMATVVREAIDQVLEGDEYQARVRRALSAIGKYRDREGATDVAVNHDKYLADAYEDWRR